MQRFSFVLRDPMGLHARPCGLLVKEVKGFTSLVTLSNGQKSVEATRLMALMAMGCKGGDTVTVTVEGPDEEAACLHLQKLFEAQF